MLIPNSGFSDEVHVDIQNALFFDLGLVWQGQSFQTSGASGSYSANGIEANPLFTSFAAGFRLKIGVHQYLDMGLTMYLDEYVYRADLQKAFPTQAETGKETGPLALVLGLMPAILYAGEIELSPKAVLGLGAGLAFNFRIPLMALDNSTGIDKIGDYLFGAFKVINPVFEVYSRFPAGNHVTFGPYLRAYLPIYRIWDGDNLPFWDTLLASVGATIHIRL